MKILIQHRNLIAGGIESSLLNFINELKSKADIDLYLFNNDGALSKYLPKDINIIVGNKNLNKIHKANQITSKSKHTFKNFVRGILSKIYKISGLKKFYYAISLAKEKQLKTNYDVSIAYTALDDMSCKFVLRKTKAKKKIAIIHGDPQNCFMSKYCKKCFLKFDKIVCVSKSCANEMKIQFPKIANKIEYLYNFQNYEQIIEKSNEFDIQYPKNILNIVSVSRLSEEKGLDRSLSVFKKLKDDGYKFIWHVIGDGIMKNSMIKFIQENKMEEYVKIYGLKSNPYPYIKAADLFFLGSYQEAAPMVFGESMILGVPVLTTKTRSAAELIGEDGFICENDEKEIYNSFKDLFKNLSMIEDKKIRLINKNFNQKDNVRHFLEIVIN